MVATYRMLGKFIVICVPPFIPLNCTASRFGDVLLAFASIPQLHLVAKLEKKNTCHTDLSN